MVYEAKHSESFSHEMKQKQPHPGFELNLHTFPTVITVSAPAPRKHSKYKWFYEKG